MSRRAKTLAILALLVAGYYLLPKLAPGLAPWSFTTEVRQYQGRFFRLVVRLDYRGEPQVFDFVVGCGVNSTLWGDGSRSREVGLIPAFYGHRMKDNKAVVIRPPDVCNGETTAGGEVPPGFMPLIIVYDNAGTLDQGLAYLSDDAYESPRSEMKFGTAEIIASTPEEFEAFIKTGVPNVVTRERYWSYQAPDIIQREGLRVTDPPYGMDCAYATKWPLNGAVRDRVRAAWPKDKPRFWMAGNWKEENRLLDGLDTEHFRGLRRDNLPEYGMPRRAGLYRIEQVKFQRPDTYPIAAFYPYWTALASREWPVDRAKWPDHIKAIQNATLHRIMVEDESWRGFGICTAVPRWGEMLKTIANIPGSAAVDETIVARNGGPIRAIDTPNWVFEGDAFVFYTTRVNTGIMHGDVK